MATDNGSIKTSDPRYKEGYKIVMPQKSKTKSKEKLTDSELNTLEKSKQHKKLTEEAELESLKKTVNGSYGTTSQGAYEGRLNVESDAFLHLVNLIGTIKL